VASLLILNIKGPRHIAQVFNAVVVSYAIYVVYVMIRPLAMRVNPHQTMTEITSSVYPNHQVADSIYPTSQAVNDRSG